MTNDIEKELEKLIRKINTEEIPSFKLQKECIDSFIKLDENELFKLLLRTIKSSKLLDETINYIIDTYPSLLFYLPKSSYTYNNCLKLIKSSIPSKELILKYMPTELYDYNFCIECVLSEKDLIKYIPTTFITGDFIYDLKCRGVDFSSNNMMYINNCLKKGKANEEKNLIRNNYENYKIDLNNFNDLFSNNSLKALFSKGITTLDLLFYYYDNNKICELVSSDLYIEIQNTTKLLKCKYFNIDPIININSKTNIITTLEKLGVSSRCRNAFQRFKGNTKDFFDIIIAGNALKEFSNLRNLGEKSIMELIYRANIVIHYYANKNAKKINTDILELNDRLKMLINENNRLKEEINSINKKIVEKTNLQGSVINDERTIK